MENNERDIVVVENENNAEKQPKTRFGAFLKKNKVSLVVILVGLFILFSVLFTYITGFNSSDNVSKVEGAETTLVEDASSTFVKKPSRSVDAISYQNYTYTFANSFQADSTLSLIDKQVLVTFFDGTTLRASYDSENAVLSFKLVDGTNYQTTYDCASYVYGYSSGYWVRQGTSTYNTLIVCDVNQQGTEFLTTLYFGNSSLSLYTILVSPSAVPSGTIFQYRVITDTDGVVSYQVGFNDGYEAGEDNVLDNLSDYTLYNEQDLDVVSAEAYEEGKQYAYEQTNNFNLRTMIFSVLEAPSKALEMFNFEIFGINFKTLVTFLISIGLIIFVIGLFKKE